MKRVYVKQGDIFSVQIENVGKRYFQYLCNDLNQLNSNVIYVFKKVYDINDTPSIEDIINTEKDFVIHTTVAAGVKRFGWEKIGNKSPKDISDVFFRTKISDAGKTFIPGMADKNWRIWQVKDDDAIYVEKLPKSETKIGGVFPPESIMEFLKDRKVLNNRESLDY